MPSFETVFLTLWKLMIIAAILVFGFMVAMRSWHYISRTLRSFFRSRSRTRRVTAPRERFAHSLEEKGFSKA